MPPRRPAFPPSVLALAALGLAVLAVEPTADLRYALFGPGEAIELGRVGNYRLDAARHDARARIDGLVSDRRGRYSHYATDYQVFALAGLPLIVRREPQPPPSPGTSEIYRGEGRLLKLAERPSSFFERLVNPAARYTNLRLAFSAYGEIPPGRTAWLLLDGDVPRANMTAIGVPLVLWALAVVCAGGAVRSYRVRGARLRFRPPRGA